MIEQFEVIIFDCDGVILNSNHIKTQGFYWVASRYGCDVAETFRDYHVANGGVSRYVKFEYFFRKILNKKVTDIELNALIKLYADYIKSELLVCECVSGLEGLRAKLKNSGWMVASGGDQNELNEIFEARGLSHLFDLGIFGSPDTKLAIVSRALEMVSDPSKVLMIGDSEYDFIAARSIRANFIFASYWTEMSNWRSFVARNDLMQISDLNCLLNFVINS